MSIPDRLLISSALALILNNIPYEYLVIGDGGALWTSYAKVVAELVGVGPMVTLALFWSIYTGDKLARNEPWERNTKVGFSQEKVRLFIKNEHKILSLNQLGEHIRGIL